MRAFGWVGAFVAAFCVGAAGSILTAADDACYREQFVKIGCNGCTSEFCANCTDSTCPGTRKICKSKIDCERGYPSGFLSVLVQFNPPCYTIYPCVPESGGTCNGENPCTADLDNGEPSGTTFSSTEVCSIPCPPV